jgi:PEP-CTERM motif
VGFGVNITGWSSVTNVSPHVPEFDDGTGVGLGIGFTLGRSNVNKSPIGAAQDTTDPGVVLVYGFGQSAGKLSPPPPNGTGLFQVNQGAYGADLLVAKGTFNGPLDFASTNNSADVFTADGATTTEPANIVLSVSNIGAVPEPASAGIAAIGALGLLRRRRSELART